MIETICTCACVKQGRPPYKRGALERRGVFAQRVTTLQHEISVSVTKVVLEQQQQQAASDRP